ncbi:MAG: hypothetical protein JXR70_08755 [Spirochaetales bacterium]|nr:hypothetical protein [Spirochaetales bacterium]
MKKLLLPLAIIIGLLSCATPPQKGPVIEGRSLIGSYVMDKGEISMQGVKGFLIVPVKNDLYMITCEYRGSEIVEINEIFPLIRDGNSFLAKKSDVSFTLFLDNTGIIFIINSDGGTKWHFKKID